MMRKLLCMYTVALSLFATSMAPGAALRVPGAAALRVAAAPAPEPPDHRPGDPPPKPVKT